MRISDGSSDVCSSDLGREVVAFGIEEQAVEHRLRGLQRRRLARAHDTVDVDQRFLARGVLVHRQGVAEVGPDVDVVDGEQRDLFRSEEHTSELQSLMRISYAVFCLKKKKQTSKQRQH